MGGVNSGVVRAVVAIWAPTELLASTTAEDAEACGHESITVQDLQDLKEAVRRHGAAALVLCLFPEPRAVIEAALGARGSSDDVGILFLGLDQDHRNVARQVPGAAYLEIPYTLSDLEDRLERLVRERPVAVLADDSSLVHEHIGGILTDAGYVVHHAMDGRQALELVRSVRPDLVVTDVQMPEMDGYDLCKQIKEDPSLGETPVVICSALGEPLDVERGFSAGADEYMIKPVDPVDFLSRVRALVRGGLGFREKVLVVDDSAPVRHLVAESLVRQGFVVETAENGRIGYEKAVQVLPDLVITDYDMPEWDGFRLVHALKKNDATRDIPVMMLTARQSQRDRAKMRSVGLSSFLVKPFSADKCVAVVERLLAERRLTAYRRASEYYLSAGTVRAASMQAATGRVGEARAEERVLSVLFVDLCGFTSLSTRLPPSDVVALLNEYFDRICPIILEEGGDIDKLIGDAVLALFADQEERSGPLAAVRAGLRLQEALKGAPFHDGVQLEARVGINTGPVIRGDIGSKHFRRDYTVIGDTVNRAQRFESQAPHGGVLVSESTYLACGDRLEARRVEGLRLKGVADPVTGYVVTAIRSEENDRSEPKGPGEEVPK